MTLIDSCVNSLSKCDKLKILEAGIVITGGITRIKQNLVTRFEQELFKLFNMKVPVQISQHSISQGVISQVLCHGICASNISLVAASKKEYEKHGAKVLKKHKCVSLFNSFEKLVAHSNASVTCITQDC